MKAHKVIHLMRTNGANSSVSMAAEIKSIYTTRSNYLYNFHLKCSIVLVTLRVTDVEMFFHTKWKFKNNYILVYV